MRWSHTCGLAVAGFVWAGTAWAADAPRNLILFVADGLRGRIVSAETAPALIALRDEGVWFRNSHSLFPTFTTANASAMATGHYLGDTGDFSNGIFAGFKLASAKGSVVPFVENDAVLKELSTHYDGNWLHETTLLAAARSAGFSTAALGKLGPTLIFDLSDRNNSPTVVFDDATGTPTGVPLSPEIIDALSAAGLPAATPSRGDNAKAGDAKTPGTTVANVAQQAYFVDVVRKVLLPMFKARGKPFMLVFWSRDPDGTQHNEGDSLNKIVPGINGPTTMAAIRNADSNLASIREALAAADLTATTDIVVTSDHGFATISRESKTSPAAKIQFDDVPQGFLPPGFLAIDLSRMLHLPLFDPDNGNAPIPPNAHVAWGNGVLGSNPDDPDIVIAVNGGSDLVYLPHGQRRLAQRVVEALLTQDYVSGIFVHDAFGEIPGTLPLSAINLVGAALPPVPAIVVNFRSFSSGCPQPTNCTVVVSDGRLQQGQGMHGSFSRGETLNFMAAVGPSFRRGFIDDAPASNADLGVTIAKLLQLNITPKGTLIGRVLHEARPGGTTPAAQHHVRRSKPAKGLETILEYQTVGHTRYFDAAGFPGRTSGLTAHTGP